MVFKVGVAFPSDEVEYLVFVGDSLDERLVTFLRILSTTYMLSLGLLWYSELFFD